MFNIKSMGQHVSEKKEGNPCARRSRDDLFDSSRGADALAPCDRKHGCALEIGAFAKVFAFGLDSDRRDQEQWTPTESAVQQSSRRQ